MPGCRAVAASLYECGDRSAWTLDGDRDVGVFCGVQHGRADQSTTVYRVASERDDRVTTHRAVAVVVHEDRRQVGIYTRERPNSITLSRSQTRSQTCSELEFSPTTHYLAR